MLSLSVRMSVAALAVLVIVGLAACTNPLAGTTGGANSGSPAVSSHEANNSHAAMLEASWRGRPREIVCDAPITYDSSLPDPHWIGTLKRCALNGAKVEFWEKTGKNYVAGDTEYFFERMLITTVGGDKIKGDDAGTWSLVTFKYQANGRVTGAKGPWAYLVGYKVHEMGYTSVVPPPAGSTVITGKGRLWLTRW